MYSTVPLVAGFTVADIDDAKLAAGVGGTVIFPPGYYEVDGLQADVFGQTWLFQDGAVLKRSDTSLAAVITVPAAGKLAIHAGTFDANRSNNPNAITGAIEAYDGATLKMSGDFVVKDAPACGIWGRDGLWDIRDGKIIDTKYWGVYWAAITLSNGRRRAPKVNGITIDRGMNSIASGMGGGICINGGPTSVIKEVQNADISDNTIILPLCSSVALRDLAYDAVAVEANYCYMPILTRNRIFGGRIGVSTQTCPWAIQSLNQGSTIGDYLIEMVNCEFGSAVGNMGTGAGASIAHYGISISGSLSKGLNIVGNNTKMLFGANLLVAPGANGGSYPHTIVGNS